MSFVQQTGRRKSVVPEVHKKNAVTMVATREGTAIKLKQARMIFILRTGIK
jgi:hypothetical protein